MPGLPGLLAAIVIAAPGEGAAVASEPGPDAIAAPGEGAAVASEPEVRPVPRLAVMPGDPRLDPSWSPRDRRLTAGVVVSGVGFGLTAVAMTTVAVLAQTGYRPPPREGEPRDTVNGPVLVAVVVGVLAAIPVTVFAVIRHKHRRPLRAYRAGLAGAGLQLSF